MITPRRTTLWRVPDLAAFRRTLVDWVADLSADDAADTCLLVPTRAAAEQLRRTAEERASHGASAVAAWPLTLTRREWYAELAGRLATPPLLLSAFDREVLLSAIAHDLVAQGRALPFEIRPGLVAEMLALYDQVRRLGRTIDDFERNFAAELEREQDTDRGAARLLEQTTFLAAAFRAYEARVGEEGGDEHALRARLAREIAARPLRRVIVCVADRIAEADGCWPADFDLLTRAPGLERIDLIATEALLAAGYLERLHAAFPDLDERRATAPPRPLPALVTPPRREGESVLAYSARDREEELLDVARRLKQQHRDGTAAPLHRTALIVRRPLPYLYLARDVFQDTGIPFETLDTLPLAAEPYAAAVDLVLDAAAADFTRTTLLALLRSPHFALADPLPSGEAVAACDYALAAARYLGDVDRLDALVLRWSSIDAPASREQRRQATALPAARAVLHAVRRLQPLTERRPLADQIATLLEWLQAFDREAPDGDPTRSRRLRVRGAVFDALTALRTSYVRYAASAQGDVATVSAALRRWLGGQTFATLTGQGGLRILDAAAARYADLDDVQIVGVIEGEWPERTRRNVLYPSSLLALLEPLPAIADPGRRERDALHAARAEFRDLLGSAARSVRLSTFALEQDAVVEPSALLDDVAACGLPVVHAAIPPSRVAYTEALALTPPRGDVLPGAAAEWAAMRLTPDGRDPRRLRGAAGAWRLPRVSVSRLELYLNCPFKFFAAQVLRLEELPEDADIQTPLERGRFLHELWERFFREWQRRGHGRIDAELVPEARALFTALCEEALASLSPSEAALERHKLLGSAVGAGIAHRVFTMEAESTAPIRERLLEYPLEGDFVFRTRDGATRTVPLNGKTDRIDVLDEGGLRVIDYKSKSTPDLKLALQLPIYAHLARESLQRQTGGTFSLREALYISFEGDKAVVPLRPARGETLEDVVAAAQDRLVRTLEAIADGQFPPRPSKRSLCNTCSYGAVCRYEVVEAAETHAD